REVTRGRGGIEHLEFGQPKRALELGRGPPLPRDRLDVALDALEVALAGEHAREIVPQLAHGRVRRARERDVAPRCQRFVVELDLLFERFEGRARNLCREVALESGEQGL